MRISPYILTGGNSTRFGTDKATFEFQGETLADRAARICEEALPGIAAKFVSRAADAFLDREVIADVFPGRGPAGAIHAALADASTPWIFVLACDLPMVTSEFILKLADHIDDLHGCVVPVQPDARWQPLCGFYRVDKCLQVFSTAISGHGKHPSLRRITEVSEPRIVEFSEYAYLEESDRVLTNVNTAADLECI